MHLQIRLFICLVLLVGMTHAQPGRGELFVKIVDTTDIQLTDSVSDKGVVSGRLHTGAFEIFTYTNEFLDTLCFHYTGTSFYSIPRIHDSSQIVVITKKRTNEKMVLIMNLQCGDFMLRIDPICFVKGSFVFSYVCSGPFDSLVFDPWSRVVLSSEFHSGLKVFSSNFKTNKIDKYYCIKTNWDYNTYEIKYFDLNQKCRIKGYVDKEGNGVNVWRFYNDKGILIRRGKISRSNSKKLEEIRKQHSKENRYGAWLHQHDFGERGQYSNLKGGYLVGKWKFYDNEGKKQYVVHYKFGYIRKKIEFLDGKKLKTKYKEYEPSNFCSFPIKNHFKF